MGEGANIPDGMGCYAMVILGKVVVSPLYLESNITIFESNGDYFKECSAGH